MQPQPVSFVGPDVPPKNRSLILLALSLAASMFESSSTDHANLANTNTELYILGIKYTTPNGNEWNFPTSFLNGDFP